MSALEQAAEKVRVARGVAKLAHDKAECLHAEWKKLHEEWNAALAEVKQAEKELLELVRNGTGQD